VQPGRGCREGGRLQRAEPTEAEICAWCMRYLERELRLPVKQIDPTAKFARLGMDSAMSVFLLAGLEEWLGMELEADAVFEHPSIAELARYVMQRRAAAGQ
jgi:acyl carrier protein